MKQFLQNTLWIVILLLVQVFVLDNFHFMGLFIPLIYIYGLLRLPASLSVYANIGAGFLVGLVMDIFSSTPGLHTSATTLMAFMRYPVLRLFVLKEDLVNREVSIRWLGTSVFWKYSLFLILIHHTTLFLLDSLSFLNAPLLLLRIVVCSLLTLFFVFVLELFNKEDNARRF
jgi:rod shape-determining protein MreD